MSPHRTVDTAAAPAPSHRQKSIVFEVTQRCNHVCLHCYNAWKNAAPYPASGELSTEQTLLMLGKLLDETGARLVSLSGGEPLLRKDILPIIDFLNERQASVNLICNGSLLTEPMIEQLIERRINFFEVPLLSDDRRIHDRLSGVEGAFDRVTLAIANLKLRRQRVVSVFVATRLNLPTFKGAAEMAIALGVDGIMFNRFNPGGAGFANLAELQASPEELHEALLIANELSQQYEISIACSIAMPPCLFDHDAYDRLSFGFCAAGTDRAYFTLDPLGNIRPCNHSMTVLGNVFSSSFRDMVDSDVLRDFMAARPDFCAQCAIQDSCLGGCKAAAEVCYGSVWKCDPFLECFKDRARPIETR